MSDYKQLPLVFPPDFVEIPLSQRGKYAGQYEAIVDYKDRDLGDLRWQVLLTGNTQYAQRNYGRTTVMLHRIIMERMLGRQLDPKEDVDHIDMKGLNCRRENLRLATRSQNKANTRKRTDNSSGYKGVSWSKKEQRFIAQIHVQRKHIHIGNFRTAEEAHAAYCEAARHYFGEFANSGENE